MQWKSFEFFREARIFGRIGDSVFDFLRNVDSEILSSSQFRHAVPEIANFIKFICLKFLRKKTFRSEHTFGYEVTHSKIVQWRMFPFMIHVFDKLLNALPSRIAKRDIGSPRFGCPTHNDQG